MAEPESLAAVLMQVAAHAERIGALDARQQAHAREAGGRLADLSAAVAELRSAVGDQAEILAGLAGLDRRVALIARRLDASGADGEPDVPGGHVLAPAVRWHTASPRERDAATQRLAGWVEQVYRPGYGHVSVGLGPCWPAHPLCLFTLDWLSELWAVLYHAPSRTARTLAGQAEFTTRIMPAAAQLMAAETSRCEHARRAGLPAGARAWPESRP